MLIFTFKLSVILIIFGSEGMDDVRPEYMLFRQFIVFSFHILTGLVAFRSFKFTTKLNRKLRGFPLASCLTHAQPPPLSIPVT